MEIRQYLSIGSDGCHLMQRLTPRSSFLGFLRRMGNVASRLPLAEILTHAALQMVSVDAQQHIVAPVAKPCMAHAANPTHQPHRQLPLQVGATMLG